MNITLIKTGYNIDFCNKWVFLLLRFSRSTEGTRTGLLNKYILYLPYSSNWQGTKISIARCIDFVFGTLCSSISKKS